MSSIRASCPNCNEVEFTTQDIVVSLVCLDNGEGIYKFVCPECGLSVSKSASARTIDLLVAAGVEVQGTVDKWTKKNQYPEHLHPSQINKPPIDLQDVILFESLLDAEDETVWFNELIDSLE